MELNCRFVRSWINKELSLAPEVVDNELDQENEKGSQHNPQRDSKYHTDPVRTGDALIWVQLQEPVLFRAKI